MSNELQALKQELQQKGSHNRLQDEELISAMREQVKHTHKSSTTRVRNPKKPQSKGAFTKRTETQGVGAFTSLRITHLNNMNYWTC